MITKTKESVPAAAPGDRLGRTREEIDRDDWFTKTLGAMDAMPKLALAPPDKFAAATKKSFIEIIRKTGEEKKAYQYTILPGLYDKEKLQRFLHTFGAADPVPEPGDAASRAIFEAARIENMLVIGAGMQVAINTGAMLTVPSPKESPIVGTRVTIEGDGSYTYSSFTRAEEYLHWLPTMQSNWALDNGWCLDIPCREVAHMVNDTERLLEYLRYQLQNLHGITVYMIQPRWLRYFSDGSMESQRSAQYGKRAAPYGRSQNHLRPLLYDNPAWVVGIRMGQSLLPGRVFVNPNGEFICSDWCQREIDKGGGIDLITGASVKHTLATWCAGPGISRFGANDPIIKGAHGEVRKARGVENLLRQHRGQNMTQSASNRLSSPILRPAFRTLYPVILREFRAAREKTSMSLVNKSDVFQYDTAGGIDQNSFGSSVTKEWGADTLRIWVHSGMVPVDSKQGIESGTMGPGHVFIAARTNKGARFTWLGINFASDGPLQSRVLEGSAGTPWPTPIPGWTKYYLPTGVDAEDRKRLYAELVKHNYNNGARQ